MKLRHPMTLRHSVDCTWICDSADHSRVRWPVQMCAMTQTYVCHDSFICVSWLFHMCVMTRTYVWHDSFIRVTWLVHMCVMTRSYVCHDSFICVSWLVCVMTRSYVCHDSAICVVWFDMWHHTCDLTHSCVLYRTVAYYSVAKTQMMPYLYRLFSSKEPYK